MIAALKPYGYAVFTVATKHLDSNSDFKMGYAEAIENLISRQMWTLVYIK